MPHSSGGGSHGGGSHGGSHSSHSHSSGRSGGGKSTRTSKTAFAGSTRYVYYRKGKPNFVYANYDIRKKNPLATIIAIVYVCGMILPLLGICVLGWFVSFEKPKKISPPRDKKIIIEDNINVIDNDDDLYDVLEEFYDKTGIVPAVVTVTNDTWKKYDNLEKYAYDDYLNRFDDERHWLIIYSEAVKEDGFNDWYWEGMQGDQTDSILTSKKTGEFTDNLHKLLLQRERNSVGESIEKAFDQLNSKVMATTINTKLLLVTQIVPLMFVALFVYLIIKIVKPVEKHYYTKAYVCDPTFVDQETCEYCGGVYVVGLHTTCPHCAAALKSSPAE